MSELVDLTAAMFLKSIQNAFNEVECFDPSDCPFEFTVIEPANPDKDIAEPVAIYSGNAKTMVRRITGRDRMIYCVDQIVNGKAEKIPFANYSSNIKAMKVAIVAAAMGTANILKMGSES